MSRARAASREHRRRAAEDRDRRSAGHQPPPSRSPPARTQRSPRPAARHLRGEDEVRWPRASSRLVADADERIDVGQHDVETEVEEIDVADGDDGFAGDHYAAIEKMIECFENGNLLLFVRHWSRSRMYTAAMVR